MSPKLRKMSFRFWRNPIFSKYLDPEQKPTPYTCTTFCATNPNNILLLLQATAQRAARSGGTGKIY